MRHAPSGRRSPRALGLAARRACCLLAWLAVVSEGGRPEDPDGPDEKPVALQASAKAELAERLTASMNLAMDHLLWFLGMNVDPESTDKKPSFPRLFRRHELNLTDGTWIEDCTTDADGNVDSVSYCVLHKLQALDAVCMNYGSLSKERRKTIKPAIKAALKILNLEQENMPGLNLQRDPMPSSSGESLRNDAEAFTIVFNGKKTLNPVIHAAAMATVTRCSKAVDATVKASTIANWFGAAGAFAKQVDLEGDLTHHRLGVMWEALSYVASEIPAAKEAQVKAAEKVVQKVEKPMRHTFNRKKELWSFSGAAAVAFRAERAQLHSHHHQLMWRMARDTIARFHWEVLRNVNISDICTCGPASGLTPLAVLTQESELAWLVIEMVSKDIRLFQVHSDFASEEGANLGNLARAPEPQKLRGAFGRFEDQWRQEGRTPGIRLDDTAVCLQAVGAVLRMVEAMPGLEDGEIPKEVAEAIGNKARRGEEL